MRQENQGNMQLPKRINPQKSLTSVLKRRFYHDDAITNQYNHQKQGFGDISGPDPDRLNTLFHYFWQGGRRWCS